LVEPDHYQLKKGECRDRKKISKMISFGPMDCHFNCRKTSGCQLFTYNPNDMACILYSECQSIQSDSCPGKI